MKRLLSLQHVQTGLKFKNVKINTVFTFGKHYVFQDVLSTDLTVVNRDGTFFLLQGFL